MTSRQSEEQGSWLGGQLASPVRTGWGKGGREAVVLNTVEACGEPQDRNGEVTLGDRQHKAAAGTAHGEPRGPRSPQL